MDNTRFRGYDLDMTGINANIVKYVNSGVPTSSANCEIQWNGSAVPVLYALRDIRPGTELLATYSV